MASIFDMFASQLGEGQLDQIATKLGANKDQTRDAISMTLPALIEALGRKAEQAGGAEDIHAKLGQATQSPSRAAEDDILPPSTPPMTRTTSTPASRPPQPTQQLPTQRQSAPQAPTSSLPDIFGELLGNKQGRVSDAVSKSSGLNKEQAGSLISMLGPMLSGMLGSQASEQKMSPTDLTEMLRKDRAKVQQSPGGGMVGKMLDQDGDGDFDMNDMMKLGMGMLFKK